jgi:RNA polymerase sigma-B factor
VALAELPEREREVVTLRYGADLNASEIGAAVGAESAAIRKMLERTRTRLAARIDELLAVKEDRDERRG